MRFGRGRRLDQPLKRPDRDEYPGVGSPRLGVLDLAPLDPAPDSGRRDAPAAGALIDRLKLARSAASAVMVPFFLWQARFHRSTRNSGKKCVHFRYLPYLK